MLAQHHHAGDRGHGRVHAQQHPERPGRDLAQGHEFEAVREDRRQDRDRCADQQDLSPADNDLSPAFDIAGASALGVVVANGQVPENYLSVAEATIMLMLALSRDLPRSVRSQDERKWVRWPSRLLDGKTVGILGVGAIAEVLAPKCKMLGMTVVGFTSAKREVVGFDRFAVYVFDYGAPTGFRIATRHPDRITAIISQNGNAYEEGLSDGWNPIRAYWRDPSETNRQALPTLHSYSFD